MILPIVKRRRISSLISAGILMAASSLLVSCENPQKQALRELEKAGIEPSGQSLLIAIEQGNDSAIRALIQARVDLEQRDENGYTPLRLAVERSDSSSVKNLLSAKADYNSKTTDGTSCLSAAVFQKEIEIAALLVEAGADVNVSFSSGEAILPWAMRELDVSLAEKMLESHPDPRVKDCKGNPLLHVALQANRPEWIGKLVKQGADLNQKNAKGETILDTAVRESWKEGIPSLLEAGGDANLPGPTGKTPLEQAFLDPDPRIFQIFLDHHLRLDQMKMDGWLIKAVDEKKHDLVGLLLSRGAHSNARDTEGWLPIEKAVIVEDASLVKMLADYGSHPGRTMHLAAAKGDPDMVRLLLFLGMAPDVVHPPFLDRPLSTALRLQKDAAAAALIRGGAEYKFKIPEGQPLLNLAVMLHCRQAVRAFLESGANPNEAYETPANPALIRLVKPGVVRWALKMDRNLTPLMVAADAGDLLMARDLIRFGAKKETKTRVANLWPINFASRRADVKMMRLMLGRDPQKDERHIIVNLAEQRARVFGPQGEQIFTTKVSTGKKGYETPAGEYVITNKYRDWTSTLYHARMPYFQRLSCSEIGLHAGAVPGYPASHGCIRVPSDNAVKLFSMMEAGDRVMIVP